MTTRIALAALTLVATVVALAIHGRAKEWARWDALDRDEPIVGMPTWPYRGEVN